MSIAASRQIPDHQLVELAREASGALDALLADATAKVRERVVVEGRVVGRVFDREQRATHGLAWFATYVEAVRQLAAYAERMAGAGTLGEAEDLLVRIGLGEYLAQVMGGIPMSQGEVVRRRILACRRPRSPPASTRRSNVSSPRHERRAARPPDRTDTCKPWRHDWHVRSR